MTLERPMFPPRAAAPAHASKSRRARSAAPASGRRLTPPMRPLVDVDSFPDVYALQLDGVCLEPLLHDGTALVMQKSAAYEAGDVVCIWWRPHVVETGMHSSWIKQLSLDAPPWVPGFPFDDAPESDAIASMQFRQFNPPGSYRIPCRDVQAIHRVIGWADAVDGHIDLDRMLPISTPRLPSFVMNTPSDGARAEFTDG